MYSDSLDCRINAIPLRIVSMTSSVWQFGNSSYGVQRGEKIIQIVYFEYHDNTIASNLVKTDDPYSREDEGIQRFSWLRPHG